MKLQLRFNFVPKLLIALQLFFYSFVPIKVLATPYGGCSYGGDSRTEKCLQPTTTINVVQSPQSFFDKYGWIIFGALTLLSIVLFILLLLARRRKRPDDKGQRLPPPPSVVQP